MKNTILTLSLLASSASAQQITAAPKALFNEAFKVAALDSADDGYQACLDSGMVLLNCGDEWGGPDEIANKSPDELLGCACCESGTSVWPGYSSCSSYMTAEMAGFSSEAGVYGDLATMCSAMGTCSGRASATASRSLSASARDSSSDSVESSVTQTGASGSVTAAPSPSECNSMLTMFESCMLATPNFVNLGFKSQAECYCCASTRGQTSGTLVWTDELDQYASTCWDWAGDDASDTQWAYASQFATYCDKYSDACDEKTVGAAGNTGTEATTTATSDDESETNAATRSEDDAVTVTVTGGSSDSTETDDDGAAAGLRAGAGTGLRGTLGLWNCERVYD
ncbi:hypothetical protein LIA77_08877 [Sarocladium implicatum]|nr:hypothetical protein LIA77_08877 [Sarocladium implicatum]